MPATEALPEITDTDEPKSGPQASPPTTRKIVRATCRIQMEVADVAEDRAEHIKRRCGGVEKCSACRMKRDLEDTRRRCVTAMNAATRVYWKLDSESLDAYLVEHGHLPKKGKDWPLFPTKSPSPAYTYPLIRKLVPELHSNICATLQKQSLTKWCQERWNSLVFQDRSPPHYRQTLPIPVPRQTVTFEHAQGDEYRLTFGLLAGGEGRYTIPIRARDGYMRQRLRMFVQQPKSLGAIAIMQDRLRPGRWYVRMSYTEEKQILPLNGTKCAVNLGISCFLAAVTSTGERWLYDGDDILAFLKQVQKRRRGYQRGSRVSNRIGHGRNRTLKPTDKLAGAAERWRETRNQTIARRFVEWLVKQGVTELIIGDFTGIRDGLPEKLKGEKFVWDLIQEWPYFDLQTRIVSCAEEAGMTIITRSVEQATQTCTFCGHIDPKSVNLKTRMHVCTKCGEKKHVDVSHCEILLQRDAAGVPSKPKKGKKKKFERKPKGETPEGTVPPADGEKIERES